MNNIQGVPKKCIRDFIVNLTILNSNSPRGSPKDLRKLRNDTKLHFVKVIEGFRGFIAC